MVDASPYTSVVTNVPLGGNFTLIYRAIMHVMPADTALTGLPTLELELDYDARRTPYVQARAVLGWPAGSTARYLDPDRYDLRLAVQLGYQRITTGEQQVFRVALLRVQSIVIDYLRQTITVSACSDDGLLSTQAALTRRPFTKDVSTYVDAIKQLVGDAIPGETIVWSVDANELTTFPANDAVEIGDDLFDALTEYTDVLKSELRHDGLTGWSIKPPPAQPSGTVDGVLRVGPRGNIVAATVTHDRQQALTDVVVRWNYTVAGVLTLGYGIASTGKLPRAVAVIERKKKPPDSTTGAATAAKLLARGLRRGHAYTVEAIPMFWLRPHDTVTLSLPSGVFARCLVDRVRFAPHRGSMTLEAQTPAPNAHDTITSTGAIAVAAP